MRLNKLKKKSSSENELIDLYRKTGDIELVGQLYKPYMHLTYGVCLKYLKNREDAQDMVIKIFEDLQQLIQKHEIENFKSWLYVVAKNNCLMFLRKQTNDFSKMHLFQNEVRSFMENEHFEHPIDINRNEQMEMALKNCIDRLKHEQKQCIELFYFEEKCYQEVSAILELDLKKVKSYIQNGKRNLKICLETSHDA